MHEVVAPVYWRYSTIFSPFCRLKPHLPCLWNHREKTVCLCLSIQDPSYVLHSSVTGYKHQSTQKCL